MEADNCVFNLCLCSSLNDNNLVFRPKSCSEKPHLVCFSLLLRSGSVEQKKMGENYRWSGLVYDRAH